MTMYAGDHVPGFFVVADHTIVVTRLPESAVIGPGVGVAGFLFGEVGERFQIRVLSFAFDEQVQMVGHEDVRKYCKVLRVRGAHYLLTHTRNLLGIGKDLLPRVGAKRQEIPVKTGIAECLKARALRVHAPA